MVIFKLFAAGLIPVRNFSRDDYNGGTQNWRAVQDSLGRVYFANQSGMLIFDGRRWEMHHLPNFTSVRSLLIDTHRDAETPEFRVYAGGTNEFGYFKPDSLSGRLRYVSLRPTLPPSDRDFSEIWNIFNLNGKIWFQGDFSLYRYDGKSTVAFRMPDRISRTALIDGSIYIALQNGEILQFSGSMTNPLFSRKRLEGKTIVGILPAPPRIAPGGLLIATALDGLFLWHKGELNPFPIAIDDYIREGQLFAVNYSGDKYAFATVNNGAALYDFSSGRSAIINRANGMQNNTVLDSHFDRAGNLWLMLDNGIDYAIIRSPVSNLLSQMDLEGAGYASMLYNGSLYLGTNQGLFSIPYVRGERIVPPLKRELRGQIWSLDTISGYLFASGDAGIFIKEGELFRRISGTQGGYRVAPLVGKPGMAIASTYSGFHLFGLSNGRWVDEGEISGYDDIGGDFLQSPDGAIWKSHWIKGVFRLTLTPDAGQFSKIELFNSKSGLPTDYNNSVSLIGDEVIISSEHGLFRYDPLSGKLQKEKVLTEIFGNASPGHIHSIPDSRLIKINTREFAIADYREGRGRLSDTTTFQLIAEKLIPGFENLSYLSDEEVIISTQDGFKVLNLNSSGASGEVPPTFITRVLSGDSILYSAVPGRPAPQPLKIPRRFNSIQIDYACADFSSRKGLEFSTMLEDFDKEWSAWSEDDSRFYTRLWEGNYIFRVRTRHRESGVVTETSFRLTIAPPLYRTLPALLFYSLLLFGLGIWGFLRLRRWKRDAEEKAKERKEREFAERIRRSEQEALVKDHEIALLKSEQLEHDIRHKSNELSNITMNLIRKNEILNDIDSKIEKIRTSSDIPADISKSLAGIRAMIKDNISHDDDWKTFTENFDIVYQDYTKRLRERHPSLSASDRRICCYIRMGLSSKEIAPLVSINYRSVEMTRYRLRKKMNLDRDLSLTEYLQNL